MTARLRSELMLLGAALALLAGCAASTNEPPYPPGIHFHGKVQMGVAKDEDGNIRTVTRITD